MSALAVNGEAARPLLTRPLPALAGCLPTPRVEDLEEALRRIVVLLEPGSRHRPSAREWAALAVACDALDVDPPVPGFDLS
jgi:hypothetical protein